MKRKLDQLFLYRHRFQISYIVLAVVFVALLVFLPSIAPGGLSVDEMSSVVDSMSLSLESVFDGNVVNLPYHLLQRASIALFGASVYAIKLPSIIIGAATAVFLVLLLNRWFKSNVAVIASAITTLSSAFLFLAGSGTPAISYLFFLALILWLGSKIVGVKNPHPVLVTAFTIVLSLAIYTPHLIYLAGVILLAAIFHPHMRFAIKKAHWAQIVVCSVTTIFILTPLIVGIIRQPAVIQDFIFNTTGVSYMDNLAGAFVPFFSFGSAYESVFLSPLFGLATVALLLVGILASMNKMFTSRNTVVSLLVLFAILGSGLDPNVAVVIVVPVAVLVAAGIESIINKWYSLFPENPYAQVVGMLPMTIFTMIIIISSLSHFVFGYHYTPAVARQFNDDLTLIKENLPAGAVLLVEAGSEYDFYSALSGELGLTVMSDWPERTDLTVATLGKWPNAVDLPLSKIVTSQKSQDSDRLYIYN